MNLMERRRALMFNQGGKNYFDIHKAYDKVGWTVSNGVAYTTYNYALHDFARYGTLPFELEAGAYRISFDIMIIGSGNLNYRYVFSNYTDNIHLVNRGGLKLPSKDTYHRISYDVTLTDTKQYRMAMIADHAENATYLKNIRIEKVG